MLNQQDGHVALLAQEGNATQHTVVNQLRALGSEVGKAVKDIKFRINLRHEVEHLLLKQAVAGEAQVDDGIVRLAMYDVSPSHTWT